MKTGYVVALSCVACFVTGCATHPMDHKHAVCHKGKTIYVDDAAVDAHVRHGDYARACYGEKYQDNEKHERGKKDHDRGHDHD